MSAPSAHDIKVFVPAKDFRQSMQFYEAMGWKVNWRAEDDTLGELELAGNRVYLQNYYNEDWANNFMMHITVDDARGWWQHASRVIQEGGYEYARVREAAGAVLWRASDFCVGPFRGAAAFCGVS